MSVLRIRLFGGLDARCGGQVLTGFSARRMQELFCYLLLYRDRSHPREPLASLLWGDCPTAQSKKHLRQALWQLQAALDAQAEALNDRALLVELDWIQINPELDLWLDVAVFEQAFDLVQEVPGKRLDDGMAQALQSAASLYRGDLLEGWYQDWCLYERERIQNMYLSMLGKLMSYCEARHHFETGLAYGTRILHFDRAHERTHRRMMRLHHLAGNRTAALRQYERCISALEEELDVRPSDLTTALNEQIRAGYLSQPITAPQEDNAAPKGVTGTLLEALNHFKQIQTVLLSVQGQVEHGIRAVESIVNSQR